MPNPDSINQDPAGRPKPRRKFRRWIVLGVLVAGLIWLNGPGFRLLAPRVAVRFLEKAGLRGNFTVRGNLVGGLSFSDLRIEGDKGLASLTIDRVIPDYRWKGLVKGRLEGLTVDGIHADLRLGLENEDEPEKPPLDLAKLLEALRTVRGKIIPLKLDFKNISLAASRDGKPVITLAKSHISHQPGSSDLAIRLGTITDAEGREWPAQEASIAWTENELSLQRIDPYPGVSLRDLVVQLPVGGEPSVDARLHLDEAVLVISSTPGFESAKIDLREGRLQIEQSAKRFGIEIPASATLTSLAVELDGILPDPKAMTGRIGLLLENVVWQDWAVPELSVDAELATDRSTVAASGMMLGTAFSFDAAAPVTRLEKSFQLGDASGKFNIADVPKLLRELSARVPAIDPQAPVPPASVDGNFNLAIEANKPQSAAAELVLKPADETLATPIAIKARWARDKPLGADLTLDGLKAAVDWHVEPARYHGMLEFDEFDSRRIERWLSIVKVKPAGVAGLTGTWTGKGELKSGTHSGELTLSQATWSREAAAPITGIGGVRYDWPKGFETKGLRIQMNEQSVALEAALDDGLLQLRRFLWADGKDELAEGTASLPVPADFSKWRDTLAKDARPLEISITSRVLSLGLLKQWVPAMEKLDPKSTGQLGIQVSGTYAEPTIDATLEARNLRSPAQPKLPPADLKMMLTGRDGRLVLDGSATAPDFPAAVMRANMPFRPAAWAEAPGSIKEEAIDARVDLPRIDLSRFSSLVPLAEQVSGFVTGNVVVSGKIAKPDFRGSVSLLGGGVRFKNDKFPALDAITASVEAAVDRIDLRALRCTLAGGSLQGDGSLALAGGKPGEINLRLRGSALPLVRNDFLILRSNADLRLQGTWEQAAVSGTVSSVDSIFYRDIELLPIGTPFTGPAAAALPKIDPPKTEAAAIPEPFRNWGLNVTVRTAEPFLVRGNLANGDITGSMRVGGTIGTPAPSGAFKIRDFTAALPFSTLSVRSGTATFTPATGFDPILEIRGIAEPRPYRVTVFAYGPASNPQLLLTSNPPLPENEIMTLLATGTTTSGLEDPQAASSRAMQLLLEEIRRGRFRFGKQLRPLLEKLDDVDFSLADADPYTSESYSSATLAITDRWFISAGVGATGDSRALVIWRLTFR